jgi:hypothetical protein
MFQLIIMLILCLRMGKAVGGGHSWTAGCPLSGMPSPWGIEISMTLLSSLLSVWLKCQVWRSFQYWRKMSFLLHVFFSHLIISFACLDHSPGYPLPFLHSWSPHFCSVVKFSSSDDGPNVVAFNGVPYSSKLGL